MMAVEVVDIVVVGVVVKEAAAVAVAGVSPPAFVLAFALASAPLSAVQLEEHL